MSDERKEWDRVTRPMPKNAGEPPPWKVSDPRTPECVHGWTALGWGKPGERQRRCVRCERWFWDHEWPAPSE